MADKPWYTVLVAGALALGFGFAAFWLIAFTSVDQGVAFAFLSPALLLVGYVTGQGAPSAVTSLLNRSSIVVSPADDPLPPVVTRGSADPPAAPKLQPLPTRPDPT